MGLVKLPEVLQRSQRSLQKRDPWQKVHGPLLRLLQLPLQKRAQEDHKSSRSLSF